MIKKLTHFDTAIIDTETLGTGDNAVILTISAFKFNKSDLLDFSKPPEEQCLHLYPSVTEQLLLGRDVEKGTVQWWSNQNKEAIDSLHQASNSRLSDVVAALQAFIGDCQVFCRGTDFDPPKLNSLVQQLGLKPLWKYNAVRDVRTFIDAHTGGRNGYVNEWEKPDWITPHNSLHDCIRDAMQMMYVKNKLNESSGE